MDKVVRNNENLKLRRNVSIYVNLILRLFHYTRNQVVRLKDDPAEES